MESSPYGLLTQKELRDYQWKVINEVRGKDAIIVMDTGTGKTLVAVQLALEMLEKFPQKKILFLATTKILVEQQAQVFFDEGGKLRTVAVGRGGKTSFTSFGNPKNLGDAFDIGVCTPQWFLNGVEGTNNFNGSAESNLLNPDALPEDGFVDLGSQKYNLSNYSMVVFDECHHVRKHAPFRCIVEKIKKMAIEDQPKILGLSACLSYSHEEKEINRDIENLYHITQAEIFIPDKQEIQKELAKTHGTKIETDFQCKIKYYEVPLKNKQDFFFLLEKKKGTDYTNELYAWTLYFEREIKKYVPTFNSAFTAAAVDELQTRSMVKNLKTQLTKFIYGTYQPEKELKDEENKAFRSLENALEKTNQNSNDGSSASKKPNNLKKSDFERLLASYSADSKKSAHIKDTLQKLLEDLQKPEEFYEEKEKTEEVQGEKNLKKSQKNKKSKKIDDDYEFEQEQKELEDYSDEDSDEDVILDMDVPKNPKIEEKQPEKASEDQEKQQEKERNATMEIVKSLATIVRFLYEALHVLFVSIPAQYDEISYFYLSEVFNNKKLRTEKNSYETVNMPATIMKICPNFSKYFLQKWEKFFFPQTTSKVGKGNKENIPIFTSLRDMLIQKFNQRGDEFKGMLFVQQRIICDIIDLSIKRDDELSLILRSGVIYGAATMQKLKREQTMQAYRNGDLNLLIATSVAEEGLDVPECNVVIRFDSVQSGVSFVQSKGRAREDGSEFVVMKDPAQKVKTYNQTVEIQLKAIQNIKQKRNHFPLFTPVPDYTRLNEFIQKYKDKYGLVLKVNETTEASQQRRICFELSRPNGKTLIVSGQSKNKGDAKKLASYYMLEKIQTSTGFFE